MRICHISIPFRAIEISSCIVLFYVIQQRVQQHVQRRVQQHEQHLTTRGGAATWSSRRQPILAFPTMESEYIATPGYVDYWMGSA